MSQFDVLMGPSTSRISSYQYMNGKASSSMTIGYIYILVARKKVHILKFDLLMLR